MDQRGATGDIQPVHDSATTDTHTLLVAFTHVPCCHELMWIGQVLLTKKWRESGRDQGRWLGGRGGGARQLGPDGGGVERASESLGVRGEEPGRLGGR